MIKLFSIWVICILSSCAGINKSENFFGDFVNADTGGKIILKANGEFFYNFKSSDSAKSSNRGSYWFDRKSLKININVRAAHAGLFELRLDNSQDVLFLNYPALSDKELLYLRTP